MNEELLRNVGIGLVGAMGFSLFLAIFLFVLVIRKMRHLDIPANAGFGETMLHVPLVVVLFIDLLDFALDILAAPFSWLILDRLGLRALRNIAAFEALLPFTQVIPTMTIAWLAARLLGPHVLDVTDRY